MQRPVGLVCILTILAFKLCVSGGIGCMTVVFVSGMASCLVSPPWQILMLWIPVGVTMAAATLKDEEHAK